uniref:Uncharacterized protein n=1 Tax=Globodera rostochiensis TaxID=31243 RepID=A0A914H092_GLORO
MLQNIERLRNDQLGTELGAWLNTGGGGGVKTLDEESYAVVGRAHQTSDFTERSDTPQFPVSERTETPMPYHPLLYRRDSPTEDAIMLKQSHSGKSQTTTTGSSNRINSNNIYSNHTNNRIGAITPHGMYGNGTPVGFNRRSSLTSFG